jgi:large subunit ribosomal protein L29
MSKKADFVKSIHGMNEQDLTARLEEDKQRLKKLEFAHTISPLENPMTIRSLRRVYCPPENGTEVKATASIIKQ